ncbi:DMT family transporter [Coprothermobacter platensis]|uniref:DMT family transporter n=1 Tax=Coprothermobacter platensis TaxID=108819 RepID=UPI000362B1E8|nr:DMT family transporter [Coprothermobacter platensis]
MEMHWIALFLGVLFYSSSSLLIKATSTLPVTLAFWRVFLATLVVTPFWLRDSIAWWRTHFSLPIIVASLGLTLDFVLWFLSLRFTSVAHATFIVNMAPLWVGLMSGVLLREKMSTADWLGVFLGVCGAGIMSIGNGVQGFNKGDFLALGASGGLALYLIMTRMGNRNIKSSVFTYSLFFLTSTFLGFIDILLKQGFALHGHDFPFVFAMALFPQLGGNTLVNYSLRYLPASVVSIGLLGEPIIATIASFLLFGEPITWQVVAGGLLIFGGLYATNYYKQIKA